MFFKIHKKLKFLLRYFQLWNVNLGKFNSKFYCEIVNIKRKNFDVSCQARCIRGIPKPTLLFIANVLSRHIRISEVKFYIITKV